MSGVTLSLTEDQAFTLRFCYMRARSHVTDHISLSRADECRRGPASAPGHLIATGLQF